MSHNPSEQIIKGPLQVSAVLYNRRTVCHRKHNCSMFPTRVGSDIINPFRRSACAGADHRSLRSVSWQVMAWTNERKSRLLETTKINLTATVFQHQNNFDIKNTTPFSFSKRPTENKRIKTFWKNMNVIKMSLEHHILAAKKTNTARNK